MGATDVRQLLFSLQLADSAFPSGFYTMSHGLEGFKQAKLVTRHDVQGLLEDVLVHSVGPGDATALALAHRAAHAGDWDRVRKVDQTLYASKLNAEMRMASVRSGHQIADLAAEILGSEHVARYSYMVKTKATPGCQAVASGVANSAAGVGVEQAVASDIFAFCASFAGAALRLRLTDHRQAQVILHNVSGVVQAVSALAVRRELEDLGGCVPVSDIMSAQHERAEARLFAS